MKRKQAKAELIRYIETIRDKEGHAVVDVSLGEDVTRYDPLSLNGQRDLNGDIYDYIDAQTNVIPAEVPLRVRFHGEFSEGEPEAIKQMMHHHYVMKSFDIAWDVMANFRKILLFTLFGAAMLAIYLTFAILGKDILMTEILSIVGSFSLWEAADAFLLERPRLRRERKNNDQCLNETVEFISEGGALPAGQAAETAAEA